MPAGPASDAPVARTAHRTVRAPGFPPVLDWVRRGEHALTYPSVYPSAVALAVIDEVTNTRRIAIADARAPRVLVERLDARGRAMRAAVREREGGRRLDARGRAMRVERVVGRGVPTRRVHGRAVEWDTGHIRGVRGRRA